MVVCGGGRSSHGRRNAAAAPGFDVQSGPAAMAHEPLGLSKPAFRPPGLQYSLSIVGLVARPPGRRFRGCDETKAVPNKAVRVKKQQGTRIPVPDHDSLPGRGSFLPPFVNGLPRTPKRHARVFPSLLPSVCVQAGSPLAGRRGGGASGRKAGNNKKWHPQRGRTTSAMLAIHPQSSCSAREKQPAPFSGARSDRSPAVRPFLCRPDV